MIERFLFLLLMGIATNDVRGQTMDDVYNLYHDLLKVSSYSKHVRPQLDQSKPTIVNITFDLIAIRELDEIMGKFSIAGNIWMVWEDQRLTWNPADYGNITTTRLDIGEIWKPDLIIGHPMEAITPIGFDRDFPVRVYPNGVIQWAPGDVMTTTCKIDITWFPFDTQICEVIFIPWGTESSEMTINAVKRTISTRAFVSHGAWDLIDAYAVERFIVNVYPTYNVVLKLKRRPAFVVVNVLLPVLVASILNVLVFFLPPQSGERISYSITVMLAIAVFLTIVSDNLPKTSEPMPTICYFLLTNLVMGSVIMIATILNLNLFYKSDVKPVPSSLADLFKIMSCRRPRLSRIKELAEKNENDTTIELSEYNKMQINADQPIPSGSRSFIEDSDDVTIVTWQDISYLFDKILGVLAILWLLLSMSAFMGTV
ncbi:hypothetical protein ACF0H5_016215 [Mactra antiquata]